ncbi:hypothetical protein GEMRC1_002417 [Eukaryota sp. GEM-RC1]
MDTNYLSVAKSLKARSQLTSDIKLKEALLLMANELGLEPTSLTASVKKDIKDAILSVMNSSDKDDSSSEEPLPKTEQDNSDLDLETSSAEPKEVSPKPAPEPSTSDLSTHEDESDQSSDEEEEEEEPTKKKKSTRKGPPPVAQRIVKYKKEIKNSNKKVPRKSRSETPVAYANRLSRLLKELSDEAETMNEKFIVSGPRRVRKKVESYAVDEPDSSGEGEEEEGSEEMSSVSEFVDSEVEEEEETKRTRRQEGEDTSVKQSRDSDSDDMSE